MNREQAIQVLGLDLNCGVEQLQQKWSELNERTMQKLAAATDEPSRQKYQLRLNALNEIAPVITSLEYGQKDVTDLVPESLAVSVAVSDSKRSSPLSLTQMMDLPAPPPIPVLSQGACETPSVGRLETEPVAGRVPVQSSMVLAAGTILADRYVVQRQLGSGGMGVVYAVEDRVRNESVALKVLRAELLSSPEAQVRFREEAKLASNLSHPGLVRVYDMWQTGNGLNFLTMELLRGRSLREEIKQRRESNKRFVADEVRVIGRQLCDALNHVHQRNVVHRDVKPENIWLCEDGTVKLMDFGIARLLTPSRLMTTNMAMGTAYYMAPEQLRGEEQIDHRADQFALAVVLYEMLIGQVPQGAIRPPHEIRGGVPVGLSRSVMKALDGDAAQRHRDIRVLSEELGSNPTSVWHRRKWIAIAAVSGAILLPSPWYWNSLMSYVRSLEHQSVASTSLESSVTKADLARKLGQIEELRQKADGIGKEIEQVAKNARKDLEQWESQVRRAEDGSHAKELDFAESNVDRLKPQVELAELCLALWKKHATFGDAKRNWYATAMGHIEAAREFVKDGLMPEAATELSSAETLLQTPIDWYANALEGISKWRDLCSMLDSASQSGEISEQFLEYPVQQCQTGFDNLRIANGANGLEQLARLNTEFRKLKEEVLPKREKLIAVASDASIIERMKLEASDALLTEYQAATSSVLSIDRAIREGRYDDALTTITSMPKRLSDLRNQTKKRAKEIVDRANDKDNAGKFEEAIADYNIAIELDSELAYARLHRGIAYHSHKDYTDAITDYSEALALDSKDYLTYCHRGNLYFSQEKWDEAIADYTQAIANFSDKTKLEKYEKDLSLSPGTPKAINSLAWLLSTSNDDSTRDGDRALILAKEACELTQYKDALYIDTLASAYAEVGNFDQAVYHQEQAIALAPSDKQEDFQRRLGLYLQKKPARDSTLAYTYEARAYSYYRNSDYRRAMVDVDMAVSLKPKFATAWLTRGHICKSTGDYDGAIESYSKCSELDPTNKNAIECMVKLRADKK